MGNAMSRGTGTGLIGFGIVLVVIGAVLKFAATVTTTGFNINAAVVILLVVGIIAVVIGGVFSVPVLIGTQQPWRASTTRPPAASAWSSTT